MNRVQKLILAALLSACSLLSVRVSYPADGFLEQHCVHDFVIGVFQGHRVDSDVPFPVPEGASVFQLGTGKAGGAKYRIISPDGGAVDMKLYFDKYGAKMDATRLTFIEKVMAEYPSQSTENFRIVKSRVITPSVLEMEEVRGTPLDKIFKDPTVPDSVKWALAEKYEACLNNLVGSFKEKYGNVTSREDGYIKVGDGGPLTEFFVKQDNIVVTPTGEFVVIDPY